MNQIENKIIKSTEKSSRRAKGNYRTPHRLDYLLGDLSVINAGLLITFFVGNKLSINNWKFILLAFLLSNISWVMVSLAQAHYSWRDRVRFEKQLPRLFISVLAYISVFLMVVFYFFDGTQNSRLVLHHGIGVLIALPIVRFILNQIYNTQLKPFEYLIIGKNEIIIDEIKKAFDSAYIHKASLFGVLNTSQGEVNQKTGKVQDVYRILNENENIKRLVYLDSDLQHYELKRLIDYCANNNIGFELVPNNIEMFPRGVDVTFKSDFPVLYLKKEALFALRNKVIKRAFDFVVSSLVVLFIFPILFPIIAILIKISSKGPIFFIQKRSGYLGNAFNCYKFRTMTINKVSDEQQATKNDRRITKIGAFLRKTSLDEFPQFWNVWKGEMSIVGPRPHMLKHTDEYSQLIDTFMVRHQVKPGITGWAQVQGWRGPTDKLFKMEKRVEHDVWYIENWSFFLDIECIFKTIMNIFKKDDNAF